MYATMPWVMWWRAINGRAGLTSCTPWVGTPSDCRRRTPPWKSRSIPPSGPMRILRICAGSCNPWGFPWIGAGSSPPVMWNTTVSSKNCFWICFAMTWPIAGNPGLTGTLWSIRCWPTNRSLMVAAGVPARRWSGGNCRNGFFASLPFRMNCWMPWATWSAGPKKSV